MHLYKVGIARRAGGGGGGVTLDMRAWLSMCDHALHMCVCGGWEGAHYQCVCTCV